MKYEETPRGRALVQTFKEASNRDRRAGCFIGQDPIPRMIIRANKDGLNAVGWTTDAPNRRYLVFVVPTKRTAP